MDQPQNTSNPTSCL